MKDCATASPRLEKDRWRCFLDCLTEQGTQDFAESITVPALLHAERRGEKGENEAKVETFKFLLLPCICKEKKTVSTNLLYFLIASPAEFTRILYVT